MDLCSLNFLVVDDDALLRRTTRNMLRALNVGTVLEAENGHSALEKVDSASEVSIDIVICDLNMPGMDGMAFLRHLGEMRSSVSVILMSSHDDSLLSTVQNMAAAYGVKLLGAIQKPASRDALESFIALYAAPALNAEISGASLPKFSFDEVFLGISREEFEPFYQPKLDFKTRRIIGAEALARWSHPEYGVVPPYAFIDVLEANGDSGIKELTLLILEKAVLTCKRMHAAGYHIPLSINLSVNLLEDTDLADRITQIVRAGDIAPRDIILEVTETAAMSDVAHSLESLARLKMHGFCLSIDDYGTGFSNIQQVSRIAFDELKIDRSFVRGCADKKDLYTIVESSIGMAHKLKMKCVAEGIETQEDWDTLKFLNCDIAQGYFIARPMDTGAFFEFCTKS